MEQVREVIWAINPVNSHYPPASDELKIEASNKYISEEGKKGRDDLEGILGGQPKPRVWKLEPDYDHEILQCFPKR